ncbi:MAG TPA: hypothetical protein DCG47_12325 [Spirochaetaceae bacterium]|nr:hypothetical protein [Spirochaetaceae bacterium]
MGLSLSRATMARLTMRIAKELTPLFERFKRDIRGSPVLRMDETVVQVLKEEERPPSAQSRMWVAMGYHDKSLSSTLHTIVHAPAMWRVDYRGRIQGLSPNRWICRLYPDGSSSGHCARRLMGSNTARVPRGL